MMTKPEKQLEDLKNLVKNLESVVVAYSGGVDSALAAKICYDVLGQNAVAVTASSETYPEFELEEAKKTAKEIGIKHKIIRTRELDIAEFAGNNPDRCYYCKTELFSKLKDIAKKLKFKNIVDGSNLDDLGDFRPGLKAAKEFGIRSPLKEVGLTKMDVREVSRLLGLSTWNKPAFACMSSRIPYGQNITIDKLTMVIEAESFLRNSGMNNLRVRHHGTIARIEVSVEDMPDLTDKILRDSIVNRFKEIGFNYITLDLEGLRSGSMNEVLTKEDNNVKKDEIAIDNQCSRKSDNKSIISDQRVKDGNGLRLLVFTDGASRGNPGKAGIGVAIYDNHSSPEHSLTLLEEISEYIGETTNNIAEYKALKRGLEKVVEYNPKEVIFKLDSELLVKQINKEYKVKSPNMIPLYKEVCVLLKKLPRWTVSHIPRGQNSLADGLANKGIDSAS